MDDSEKEKAKAAQKSRACGYTVKIALRDLGGGGRKDRTSKLQRAASRSRPGGVVANSAPDYSVHVDENAHMITEKKRRDEAMDSIAWEQRHRGCESDDVSFSNSLTVEHNTLGGGSISHILRNRSTNASTYAATDRWFHYDQVGSVMSESDAAGVLAQAHYQDAFGNTQASWSTGLWGGDKEGWHHNSKEFDNECALVYMFKRWYNPQLGRFSSSASYPVSKEHRFSFVENNPVSYADPKGQFRICCRPLAVPIAANFISHCFLVFDGPPVVTIGVYDENGQSVIHRNDPADNPNGKNTTCGAAIPDGCMKKCVMEFIGSYFPHVYSPTTDNCNSFVTKAVEHCGQNAGDLWPSGAGSCPGGPGF